MKKRANQKKRKPVHFHFVRPESEVGQPIYQLLRELIREHHTHLEGAYIALAWNTNWKPDVDGRLTLGKCAKVSDLHREVWGDVANYDFIIILQKAFWDDELVSDLQRRALLDHELCHAGLKLDDHGEPVTDEHGRTVYRMVKHTIEDFTEIVGRYGCYKQDLEAFAHALERARLASSDRWIGVVTLHEDLARAGVVIPIQRLALWTQDERREASTWALLRGRVEGKATLLVPTFIERAASGVEA